jgi:hypothetical protein
MRLQNRNSSITTSDFLLAATIICLDLYHGLQLQAAGRPSGDVYTWGQERRDEMLAAIQRSRDIWEELSDESMEAYKVSGVLGVMLAKLTFPGQSSDSGSGAPLFQVPDEKQNAAMTLGLLSSGMSPQSSAPTTFADSFKNLESSLPPSGYPVSSADTLGLGSPFGMFGQVPDMQPLNLDWVGVPLQGKFQTFLTSQQDVWDSYIQNSTIDNPNPIWPMLDLSQQSPSPLSQTPLSVGRNATHDLLRSRNRLPGMLPSDTGLTFDPTAPGLFMNSNSNNPSPPNPQPDK